MVIQTYDPGHRVIQQVIENNYIDLYNTEMTERKNFKYPPFYRLIQLDIKHRDAGILYHQAEYLAKELRKHFDDRVIGPEYPLVGRIRNYFIKSILLKFEKDNVSLNKVKATIREVILQYNTTKLSKGSIIQPDVDPY